MGAGFMFKTKSPEEEATRQRGEKACCFLTLLAASRGACFKINIGHIDLRFDVGGAVRQNPTGRDGFRKKRGQVTFFPSQRL